MRLLEPRKVDDFSGKPVYTSGRVAPFAVHYRIIDWALNKKHAKQFAVFIVEAPEPLDSTCPFTNEEREQMIKNCFPEVDAYIIPPLTSLKNINKARKIIYNILDHDAVYIGGEFQHIFAAKLGGYKIADYRRGMFGYTSATEVRNLMYENNKRWKAHIPSQNYELLEEIIQTERFRKAMQTEPPQGNLIKRAMRRAGWVH